MAEQQLTQEELGQEQQVFDSLPPVGPGPEPKKTVTPGPAIVPKQDMFAVTEQQLRPTAVKEQKVLPKEKERQPIFLGDLSQAEETFKNYATFDKAEKAKPVVSGGMIGGMGGFTAQNVFPTQADADAYMVGVRQNKAQANVLKSQTIKQLTDSKSTQKLSDFIFGSTEDIIKQGGNVSKFIIKNSAGQDIIDPGKVRQEIDKVITAKGNNGGRYMREFFASKITSDDNLDMILSVYKNRDKINKAMPTGVSKKEIDGFLTEKKAEMAPKLQSQIKVQDNLLSEKVENIKSKYSTELTDAGVDLNVYYTAAQNDVAKEVPELTMSADPATQAIFARRVEDRFNQQYAQYVMPKLQDITDRMAAEIKTEVSNVNSAIKRIYKENNAVLQREYQGWLQTRNKELSDKFNQTAGQIILDGVTQKRNEAKAYAENMLDMSTRADVLGAVSIGKILGDTFTASAGGFKNKTALIMNALGFEADWIDEMRYSGKSQEVQFSMEKLPLEQNWMKPGYWAQSLAQSAPTMALGMVTTALTGNPYVGGIVSFMTESMENSGGVMERVLANTGDLDAANLAGGQTFIKNVPTVVSDILFQRMFSPLKVAKGTAKEKVRDLGVSMFAEGATEAWQTASEMSSGVDAKMGFGRAFVSRDARNAAIEGAVSAGALGGAGVTVTGAYKALFDKKNIPSIRTQAIANTILANGETAAVAGVQLDALANEADDDALNEGLKEVADVAKLISDAQQVGLTPQQTQLFVSMSKELADMKANLATITDPTARKIIENQISAKEKEVDGIVSGKTPIATIELQPGLVFTGTVDGVRNVMNVPEVKAEVEAGNVNIITDDQGLNTEVEQARTAPTRQRNIISDTGEIVGQVPAEAAPVTEAAPAVPISTSDLFNQLTADEKDAFTNDVLDAVASFKGVTSTNKQGEQLIQAAKEGVRKNPVGELDKAISRAEEVLNKAKAEDKGDFMSSANIEASQNALNNLNQIKQKYATQISERAQQEVPQPSDIVQREGTQEGQPQVGQAEGAVGQTTQPAADTRNRDFGSQAQEVTPPVAEPEIAAAEKASTAPVSKAETMEKYIEREREKLKEKYGVYLGGEFENHYTIDYNTKTQRWEIRSSSAKYNETKGYREFENKTVKASNVKDREGAVEELMNYAKEKGLTIYDSNYSLGTEATAFTKENREKFDAELAALKAAPMAEAAPVTEVAPVVEAPSVTPVAEAPKTEEQVTQEQLAETDILLTGEAENRRKAGFFVKDGVEFRRNEKGLGEKGTSGDVRFTNEVSIPFSYKLIEAETLQPSHQNGLRNPLHFIPEAQPKNRNDEGSLQAEESFANNPRFDELGENTNAYSGAPIVNERNEVVQGNNRAAGLKKGYDRGNQMYKAALLQNADKFGFTREQVQAMKNPVLVREVAVSDAGAIEIGNYDAKDLETGGKRRIDPVAVTRRMPFNVKGRLAEIFKGDETINESLRKNTKLVFDVVSPYLNQSQRNTLFKDGVLTEAGAKDLEAVVQHLLFDGGDVALPDLFDRMGYTQKEGLKKALPFIFSTTQEKSIVPEVQEAIIATNHFNESGAGSFAAWLAQPDMFNESRTPKDIYTPVAIEIAKRLNQAKTQKEVAKVFGDYANEVNDRPATMFEPAQAGVSKKEGIEKTFKVKYDETKKATSIERGGRAISQEPTAETAKPAAEAAIPESITKPEIEYNSRNLPNPIGEFDVVEVIPYTKPEANKFAPDQQLKFNQGDRFEPVRIVGNSDLIELIQIGARIKNNLTSSVKKPINRERQKELEEKYNTTATKANTRARELAKANRGDIESIIIIGEVPTGEAKIKEILTADTKQPTNLEKVFNFLDGIDKSIDKNLKSGTLRTDISVIPLAAIQTMVKALKVLVQGGMTLQEAIRRVAIDNNYTEKQFTDALNTIAGIEETPVTKERKIPSPRVGRLLGTLKDVKNVSMTEKAALEKQIKDLARGAKDAITAWRNASSVLGKDIKEMARKGQITAKQAGNIIKKFGKINILSPKAVSKFVDYMTKVFSDAEYENKLSTGKSVRKDISKLSKNKDKNANLRDVAKRFLDIDPSMVDDIDAYNTMANSIKESLVGSKAKKTEVAFASIINIDDTSKYINITLAAQQKKIKDETAAEIQELMGIDVSEFSYDDMLALLEKEGEVPKGNEAVIRAAINKAFSIYSSIIKKTLAKGEDQFTEMPFEISEAQKDLVNRFMAMDLNMMSTKDAIAAVDALNNFITNKSTAKMDAVVSDYTGRMNAKKVKGKGIKSTPLKKYFSPSIGRILAEQTTSLGALFERMFKGVKVGGFVEDMIGLTKVKNGKAQAETIANNIAKEYVELYYAKKANGEVFNSVKNMVERGMIAFLSRNIIGSQAERDAEFARRKNLVKESIDLLLRGAEKEVEKGNQYKEIFDKLGVEAAKSIDEITKKADKLNVEAVNWWTNKWSEIYPQLSDVSQGVYNKILDKDTDYNPDRFKRVAGASEVADLANEESAFHYNLGTVYKKETGILMSATRPETLPLGKRGKPEMYIDLSFDNNNASSMYDALVDIKTASAIRQVDGFLKSSEFDDIVNADDKKLLERRISLYVRKIRNKAPFVDDELERGIKRLNNLAAVGVGQALGGFTQPFKQVVPVVVNTIVNAGRLDVSASFDKDKNAFINRSGYAIANRGVESQAQIDSINRIIEVAASGTAQQAIKNIEKVNNFWLKTFLVKPDAWIARSSWITYYEESLKEQGIDPSTINWATHEVNEEAGNYAQRMVDRQQNISDPAQAGALFADSDNSFKNFIVKMAMPFASFRINQATRLANDLSVLSKWSVSTREDKVIAARSLAGFAAEMATFRLMSAGISILIGNITNLIMGEDEEKEDFDKRVENTFRGQATGAVTDILSPIPVLDKAIQFGVFTLADDIQTIAEVAEEDKVNIFEPKPTEFLEGLGLLGITAQRGMQLADMASLSMFNGSFEDKYGNEKFLIDNDKQKIKMLIVPGLLSSIGILPSEVNSVVRKGLNDAKKRALTEKQMRVGGKKKRGGGGGEEGFGGEGFGGGDGFGGGGF